MQMKDKSKSKSNYLSGLIGLGSSDRLSKVHSKPIPLKSGFWLLSESEEIAEESPIRKKPTVRNSASNGAGLGLWTDKTIQEETDKEKPIPVGMLIIRLGIQFIFWPLLLQSIYAFLDTLPDNNEINDLEGLVVSMDVAGLKQTQRKKQILEQRRRAKIAKQHEWQLKKDINDYFKQANELKTPRNRLVGYKVTKSKRKLPKIKSCLLFSRNTVSKTQ